MTHLGPIPAANLAARLAQETGAALTLLHMQPGGVLQYLRQWLAAIEHQFHDDAQRQPGVLVSELQKHRHVTARGGNTIGSVLDKISRTNPTDNRPVQPPPSACMHWWPPRRMPSSTPPSKCRSRS
jgi:hypothetical protein